jgi:hypothetical protein
LKRLDVPIDASMMTGLASGSSRYVQQFDELGYFKGKKGKYKSMTEDRR